jgi:glycerol dehydrogenase-like iron-containing ADH family enzyme
MLPGSEPWSGSVRPKQPIHSPLASLGRYFWLLRLAAEFVDGHHHQRALHAGHRAVARVHALHFAGDQAVGHVAQAGAAVLLGDGGAQQAHFAHLAEDARVHLFVAEGVEHARRQLVLAVGRGRVADGALVVSQLLAQEEGIVPLKSGVGHVRVSGGVGCWGG